MTRYTAKSFLHHEEYRAVIYANYYYYVGYEDTCYDYYVVIKTKKLFWWKEVSDFGFNVADVPKKKTPIQYLEDKLYKKLEKLSIKNTVWTK